MGQKFVEDYTAVFRDENLVDGHRRDLRDDHLKHHGQPSHQRCYGRDKGQVSGSHSTKRVRHRHIRLRELEFRVFPVHFQYLPRGHAATSMTRSGSAGAPSKEQSVARRTYLDIRSPRQEAHSLHFAHSFAGAGREIATGDSRGTQGALSGSPELGGRNIMVRQATLRPRLHGHFQSSALRSPDRPHGGRIYAQYVGGSLLSTRSSTEPCICAFCF